MKKSIIQFLISRAGGILTPIIAAGVAWCVAKLAAFDASLASGVDQAAITAFVWGLILSAVNAWTNKVQSEGVKNLQLVVRGSSSFTPLNVDGWAGPKLYAEVRKAVEATEDAEHAARTKAKP
jgi:hypothetical protein